MKKLLIPLVLLFLGLGGGVGAGLLLKPPPTQEAMASPCGDLPASQGGAKAEAGGGHAEEAPAAEAGTSAHDYVRLNNQFVVPLLSGGQVASLAMLSLSVEVPAGQQEAVHMMEPKLRDIFLQVLFDHANTGGFDGLFTSQSAMRELRGSLLAAAQEEMGPLVTDIVRQDQ